MMRVVPDVNVIISAIIAPLGTPRQVLNAWQAQRFTAITSEGIIAQVEEKLHYPRIGQAYGITEDDIRWVGGLLRTQAKVVVVPPGALAEVVDDPEDDYVLATGIVGEADYLVTGDRELLALREHQGMKIVSPRAFLEISNRG